MVDGGIAYLGTAVSISLDVPVTVDHGGTGAITLTNHGVLLGQGTSAVAATAAGSSGQVLQSGGASADPAYSTATYPSTATGTGTILRANGTNWVATTATYPATTTVSQILYSSSSNVIGGITTANNSVVLTDASGVPSLSTTLANSFAFTASSSGATISTTVSNTSNTASSNALQQVTVAGTSAGDAFTTYTVSGTSNWSIGVDNSDSDAFVISSSNALGTTNTMRIANGGETNFPLQPAFLAYLDAQKTDKTGAGTQYDLGADALTEVFDVNGDFNTNGTFTAPVDGKYLLQSQMRVGGLTTAMTLGTYTLDTSNRDYQYESGSPGACKNGSNTLDWTIIQLADMESGDTAVIKIRISNGAGNTADIDGNGSPYITWFSGNLVC